MPRKLFISIKIEFLFTKYFIIQQLYNIKVFHHFYYIVKMLYVDKSQFLGIMILFCIW